MRRLAIATAGIATAVLAGLLWLHARRGPANTPAIFLWAWERPEDLRYLDTKTAGVAYLSGTITLRGDDTIIVPRLQPLRVASGASMSGVVRIETDAGFSPSLSNGQRKAAVEGILRLTYRPGAAGCQVDFDAVQSQRGFYAALIRDLRRRLPGDWRLSITALASWCLDDDWIAGLPVDEAVPMLFRMGPDGPGIRRRLQSGSDFQDRACRTSAGVSTDEPLPPLRRGRRVYIFHPKPWTEASARAIIGQVRSWQ